MGYYRGSGLPQQLCGHSHRNRHNVLHSDPAQNTILHSESDSPNRADILPLCVSVLPASGGWGESHPRDQHSPLTRRVSLASLQNTSSDVAGATFDRQILIIHIHHEHCKYPSHCYHHQLELPWPSDSQDATLDTLRVPLLPANLAAHEETEEDATQMDDGNARHVCAASSFLRVACRASQTYFSTSHK